MTRALIVDDRAENLYYLRVLLESQGWDVDEARHGAEALKIARDRPPDLVVSDLLMPVMDGYTLLRHWKADARLAAIPFVVYTATYTEAEDERLALNMGADAFVLKPCEPDEFMARVRTAVSARAAVPTAMPHMPVGDERALLEEYSEALIRKLEEKTLQLEATNAALVLERARLVAAQQVAQVGSWESTIPSGEVMWSDEMHRLVGTDPATFTPSWEAVVGMVHPDDRARFEAASAHSLTDPGPQELEHRLVGPGGSIYDVVVRWQVFHDEHGAPVRAIGTYQDITARRRAEQEVNRTAALLQAVADSTSDAVFVKDLEGRYLFINQAALVKAGRTAEQVLGFDDRAVFGPDDARMVMEGDRHVMLTGRPITTVEVLTSAGVTRTFEATKAPYRDADGNVIGMVGISRDMTEWQEAEAALRESERRHRVTAQQLSDVLDHSRDLICSFDRAGRFTRVNAACLPMLGYREEELLGARFIDMILPEDRARTLEAAAQVMAGGASPNFENRYLRKDGVVTHIQWAVSWSEEDQTMFSVGRDVTANKILQAQFLRAQRMESIGTLAGGIAHDLNNVLTPIMMSIDLLRMDEADPRRLAILDSIEGSARRGADMVKQVLSFARGVEREQQQVDVAVLLREVEKITNETFLKSIDVQCRVPDDVWTVHGDHTQLHQVLMNLCVNARDSMPNGGRLTISAGNVELGQLYADLHLEARPGRYVLVQVEDTGSGIPADVMDRVFEPFFTTKDLGKGTGLGLSTSQGIVASHGGFLQLYSEVGIGTKVGVYLPASTVEREEPLPATASQLPRGRGEQVLLVDDEAAVLQITQQTLEAFGYRVLVATDGVVATKVFEEHRSEIDVVITDMMMPVMDGAATIAALTKIDPQVRLIAASGLNANGMVATARHLGVSHFITKPYNAETLLQTLAEVLQPAAPASDAASAGAGAADVDGDGDADGDGATGSTP